jgi:hypothetical protein
MYMDDVEAFPFEYGPHRRCQCRGYGNPGDRATRRDGDRFTYGDDIFAAYGGAGAGIRGDDTDIVTQIVELFIQVSDMDGYPAGVDVVVWTDEG